MQELVQKLLCFSIALAWFPSCSPPPTTQEIPEIDSAMHNEQEIDRYLQQLLNSEDRRLTGFTEAARWGRIEIVEEMLNSGTDADAQDEFGRTALVLAASGGQLEIIELLIDHGADVNFQQQGSGDAGKRGPTPLIALLSALHSEQVYSLGAQILLDAGAQTALQDQNGQDAADWANIRIKEGRLPISFLDEFRARNNSLPVDGRCFDH